MSICVQRNMALVPVLIQLNSLHIHTLFLIQYNLIFVRAHITYSYMFHVVSSFPLFRLKSGVYSHIFIYFLQCCAHIVSFYLIAILIFLSVYVDKNITEERKFLLVVIKVWQR